MSDWAVYRADASLEIGTGHIMRCLALARQMQRRDVRPVFVCRHLPSALEAVLSEAGVEVLRLPERASVPIEGAGDLYAAWLGVTQQQDAEDAIAVLGERCSASGPPERVIVDHYGLDAAWETRVAKALGSTVFVIDDLSNRPHDCAALVDTTFGKTTDDYQSLVPSDCQCLVGAQYALLRPEFSQLREGVLSDRDADYAGNVPISRVLIAMGGADKDNATRRCLEALSHIVGAVDFEVDVLVGGAYPHLDALKREADQFPFPVHVHHNVNDVTGLLSRADLALGAAGSSTWERCCLGVPTVNVVLAENQMTIARNLADADAISPLNDFWSQTPEGICDAALQPLFDSVGERKKLSDASREICDGRGIDRVMRVMLPRHAIGGRVALKSATSADIDTVFKWQVHPDTRRFARNPKAPEYDGHVSWMSARLEKENAPFYLAWIGEKPVGMVRLDPAPSGAAEVSILVSPEYFSHGIGRVMLKLLDERHRNVPILAHVKDDNTSSVALFRSAGYRPRGHEQYILAARE